MAIAEHLVVFMQNRVLNLFRGLETVAWIEHDIKFGKGWIQSYTLFPYLFNLNI